MCLFSRNRNDEVTDLSVYDSSSCSTSISLLVSILDPPSLCIFPLPTLALPVSKNIEQKEEKSIWNGLRPGWESKGATEFVKLTDWSWLVDNLDSDGESFICGCASSDN